MGNCGPKKKDETFKPEETNENPTQSSTGPIGSIEDVKDSDGEIVSKKAI